MGEGRPGSTSNKGVGRETGKRPVNKKQRHQGACGVLRTGPQGKKVRSVGEVGSFGEKERSKA